MFKVLIDTCVWLDIAKDHKQHPLMLAIWTSGATVYQSVRPPRPHRHHMRPALGHDPKSWWDGMPKEKHEVPIAFLRGPL